MVMMLYVFNPGWHLITGWLAIREIWVTIFQNTNSIKFLITNTKIQVKDIVVVIYLENIESIIEGQIIRSGARSANIFKHFKSDLEIMYHHGSIVTNYMLPNIPTNKYWNNIIGCNI